MTTTPLKSSISHLEAEATRLQSQLSDAEEALHQRGQFLIRKKAVPLPKDPCNSDILVQRDYNDSCHKSMVQQDVKYRELAKARDALNVSLAKVTKEMDRAKYDRFGRHC